MTNSLPGAETVGISPKTLWAGLASLGVGVLATGATAALDYTSANPALLAGLPPIVVVAILAMLAPLSAALAAYKASPGLVVTPGSHELS